MQLGESSVWPQTPLALILAGFRFYFYFKSEFVAEVQHPQVSWVPGTTKFLNQYWLILRNKREMYLYSDVLAADFLSH